MNPESQSFQSAYVNRLRRRRFQFFETLAEKLEKPVRVLDCGGTIDFWQTSVDISALGAKFDITIINLMEAKDDLSHKKCHTENIPIEEKKTLQEFVSKIKWHMGDVRDLTRFHDREFERGVLQRGFELDAKLGGSMPDVAGSEAGWKEVFCSVSKPVFPTGLANACSFFPFFESATPGVVLHSFQSGRLFACHGSKESVLAGNARARSLGCANAKAVSRMRRLSGAVLWIY